MPSRRSRFACLLLLGVLPGCMVGPDPTPPSVVTADAWHEDLVEGLTRGKVDPGAWWRGFDDPMLVDLVATAERNNFDLRTAASRIREARSLYGIAAADLYPEINATGEAEFIDGNQANSSGLPVSDDNFYSLGLDFGWEIDLWGRVRRGMQAAEFDLQAQIEDARDILVTIRAEVARSYIEARSLQGQIVALRRIVAAQAETVNLARDQFRQGVVTEFSLLQAQAQLQAAEAKVPSLEYELAVAINRLSVLIAEPVASLRDRLDSTVDDLGVPDPPREIAVGIPADVIRRRPDIRAAERLVGAAAANIGVAEAALYPSLRLTGQGGYTSTQFDRLVMPSNLGGLLAIEVSWPIFTAGRLRSVIDVRNEQAYQALVSYEATVFGAIADVETSLVAYGSSLREQTRLRQVVDTYDRAATLATARLEQGVDDLEALLDIERELLGAVQELAVIDGQVAANAVGIYKALGGSWNIEENTIDARATTVIVEDAG